MAFGDLKVQDLIYEDSSNNEITVVIADLATKANPTFTGTVTVPTATAGDNSTKAASTAFVVASFAPKAAPAFTGNATGVNLTLSGDLTVNGTTTTINTTTLQVEDKNIEIGKVSSPSDTTADGGGWTLLGSTSKTFNWLNATDSWTSSEHIEIASGKNLKVDGTTFFVDGTNNAVGIGTTSPQAKLEIYNATSGDITLLRLRSDPGVGDAQYLAFDGGSNSSRARIGNEIVSGGHGNLVFETRDSTSSNLTERMRITSAGRVGIGTNDPFTLFDIQEGTTGIRFNRNNNTPALEFKGNNVTDLCRIRAAESAGGGVLQLHTKTTGGTDTERLRIGTSGEFGIAGANYGTSGQVLTSGGSGAAPSWADVGGSPEIEATATGAIAIQEACIVRTDGTIEKVTGQNDTIGTAVEYHSGSGSDYIAPMRVVYNPDKNNNVIFYLKGTGSNSQYPSAYCRSVTISGTTVSYGTQRMIPTDGSSSGEIGGYFGYRGLDCCYDTTNDRFMLTYINKDWGRVHTAVGYANSAGDDITFGAGYRLMGNPDTQDTRNLRCCFNPDNSRVALFWTNTNNHVWMAQGKYDNDNADWDWDVGSTQVTSVSSSGMIDVAYDTNLDRYLATWRKSTGSNNIISKSFSNTLSGGSSEVSLASGEVSAHSLVFVPSVNKFVEVYATNTDTWKLHSRVCTVGSSSPYDPSWGSEVTIDTDQTQNMSAVLDSATNNVIASWYSNTESKRYASVGTVSGTTITWTPRFEVLAGAGESAVGWNANVGRALIAVRDGQNDDAGDAAAFIPGSTNLTSENFIGFAKAAISNGATGSVKIVGNTATKSSLTPGQKYYLQFDGSLGLTPVTGTDVYAGVALSSTKLLIKG
tara:strand:+ start:2756 stop:5353 length:2598 start_codon:yes stop_codon:yes gene_type:complete